ncbi:MULTISPECIES: hypothetical protein [Methylocaldum]|uniref:hypothetical protein n=1 Tax=unclassified Methylocaldum TaxID=2622260 RepID=UPI001AE6B512|nr:hypothetical protein [Methylocaldum sp. RMAD-M]MBP1149872.1 hypothetical protein [Methylocaldum sp. RMAD-M]
MSRHPPLEVSRSRLFFRLLGWRLRHYADATLKLLLRRWQSVLFALLVVSPAATPLAAQIDAVGMPVRKIVEGGSPAYALTAWLTLSLLAIAWAAVQADALRGGAPWRYLRTLPGLSRFETGLDLTLLLIADLPLLLPFVAYGITLLGPARSGGLEHGLLALALGTQWPIVQQLVLRGSWAALLVAASALIAMLALCVDGAREFAFVLLTGGPIAAFRLRRRLTGVMKTGSWRIGSRIGQHLHPVVNLAAMDALALMQWSQLPARVALLAYAGILGWFGTGWEAVGFQPQVAVGLLLAGFVPLIFQVAGLALTLRAERAPMRPLLASLGIGTAATFVADLLVLVAAFCLLAFLPVAKLYPLAGSYAFLILPLGSTAVAVTLALYSTIDATRFWPKLVTAAAFWLAAWRVVMFH